MTLASSVGYMVAMSSVPSHYTTTEVADMCRTTTKTVARWIKAGQLTAATMPGGNYRIHPKPLLAFLRKHNYHVPPALWSLADDAPEMKRLYELKDSDGGAT